MAQLQRELGGCCHARTHVFSQVRFVCIFYLILKTLLKLRFVLTTFSLKIKNRSSPSGLNVEVTLSDQCNNLIYLRPFSRRPYMTCAWQICSLKNIYFIMLCYITLSKTNVIPWHFRVFQNFHTRFWQITHFFPNFVAFFVFTCVQLKTMLI